jgi:hypothetical protein
LFNFSGSSQVDNGDRIHVYQVSAKNRLLIEHNNGFYYGDFGDQDSTGTLQTFNVQGSILNMAHSPGVGGEVFLAFDNTQNTLSIVKFDDGATTPVAGLTLVTASSALIPTPKQNFPVKGTITPIDYANDDYLFALEYTVDGQVYTLWAGHAHGQSVDANTFTKIGANVGVDMEPYAITHDVGTMYLWSHPSPDGPPQGPAPLYVMDIPSWKLTQTQNYQPPDSGTAFYVPFTVGLSTPGNSDITFIEGDLQNQNATPRMHSARVQTSALATMDPQTIPYAVTDINSLPFNKGTTHWSSYQSEDDWIAASRPLQDNTVGVNFVWVDSLGRLRANLALNDGGSGFPTADLVNTIDVTFTSQPTPVFTGIRAAWIEGQTSQNNPKVISASGSCIAN